MKIFVSWSGELSHAVALALKDWLPSVIQTIELYVSSEDIDKGTRWFADIGTELEDTNFGIVCLTRENMSAPWILFEAGAISKSINQSRVTPLLINLPASDLEGPLVQFQATTTSEQDIRRLVKTINNGLGELSLKDYQIDRAFDKWWPDLKSSFEHAIEKTKDINKKEEKRPERQILEEVLQITRTIARSLSSTRTRTKKIVITSKEIIEKIKRALEKRNRMFLVIALEGASNVRIKEGEMYIEFSPTAKHLRDNLAKPESIRLLREVCHEVTGRDMSVHVVIKEEDNTDTDGAESFDNELTEKQRLREIAERDPLVQQAIKAFRGEIIDVRRLDEDEE
jgi:hypothetical protein